MMKGILLSLQHQKPGQKWKLNIKHCLRYGFLTIGGMLLLSCLQKAGQKCDSGRTYNLSSRFSRMKWLWSSTPPLKKLVLSTNCHAFGTKDKGIEPEHTDFRLLLIEMLGIRCIWAALSPNLSSRTEKMWSTDQVPKEGQQLVYIALRLTQIANDSDFSSQMPAKCWHRGRTSDVLRLQRLTILISGEIKGQEYNQWWKQGQCFKTLFYLKSKRRIFPYL